MSVVRGTLIYMTMDMISYIRLGREVIDTGRLRDLRTKLGFSYNLMSELFHVTPITYTRWERGAGARLKPIVAEKLGRFYLQASQAIEEVKTEGVDIATLIPFHLAAAAAGVPQEHVLSRFRAGDITGVDLGILGMWLPREELPLLKQVNAE